MRAYDQALALPANDLAAATALLDARFLTGDEALADKFLAAFRARVAKTAAEDFVARLRAEQKERHSRFGDTIFLLEPDLKNGPGGLRDLCVGRWAAMARFGTSDPKQLLAQGVMTGRLAQAFTAATEWLMRVRILMHATAGRRQDHLRFALQEAIAPILYPEARDRGGVIRPAVHPAVEALMHQYHAHAKLIRNETERLLQRATAREDKRRKTQPVMVLGDKLGGKTADANFVVRDGALEPIDPGIFERKPSEMIRIFQLAIDLDVPLALRTRELLGELAASQPGAAARGRRGGPALRRARVRHARSRQPVAPGADAGPRPAGGDHARVGAVDRAACSTTSITCTPSTSTRCTRSGGCTRSQRGDHAAAFPIPTETVREVTRPVGAGGRDAAARRRQALRQPAQRDRRGAGGGDLPRLGIEEQDTQRVEFLVRQHLVMGQMSQRRDLEDLGMISDFAALCGDEENLRELYLLTFCDLASVAPDAMSSWKETLLAELYTRTLTFLRRGPDLLGSERAEIVAERQKGAARLLGEPLAEGGARFAAGALFARVPEPLLRREHRDAHRVARAPDARAARAGQELAHRRLARHAPGHDGDGAGRRRHARPARRRRGRAVREPDRGRRRGDLLAAAGRRERVARGAGRVPRARQHGPPGHRRGALDEGARGSGGRRVGADQGGDPGRPAARARSRWPAGRRRSCRPSARSTTTSAATSPSSR